MTSTPGRNGVPVHYSFSSYPRIVCELGALHSDYIVALAHATPRSNEYQGPYKYMLPHGGLDVIAR